MFAGYFEHLLEVGGGRGGRHPLRIWISSSSASLKELVYSCVGVAGKGFRFTWDVRVQYVVRQERPCGAGFVHFQICLHPGELDSFVPGIYVQDLLPSFVGGVSEVGYGDSRFVFAGPGQVSYYFFKGF